MGASVIKNAKIFLDGMDLSGDLNALALNYSAEMLDGTGLGDNTRVRQGGLLGITCNAEGFVNTANSDQILHDAIAANAEPVTIGANGGACCPFARIMPPTSRACPMPRNSERI